MFQDDCTSLISVPAEHGLDMPLSREDMEATATYLAETFQTATAEIAHHMRAIEGLTKKLHDAFQFKEETSYGSYWDIDFYYNGSRYNSEDTGLFNGMARHAWEVLVNQLGIKNIMSIKQRNQFEDQLKSGDLPPISPQAILDIICNLAGSVEQFKREAAVEVFGILRPQRGTYKTNDKYRVGKKVILSYFVEPSYNSSGFRPNHYREKDLRAIDGVFHLLAGKGVIREYQTPLLKAIATCENGVGQTDLFKFRCYKNHNLHLEFRDLELVKQLNLQAVGEYVLGKDEDNE